MKTGAKTIALVRPDVPADFPLGRMGATVPLGLMVLAGALREAGFGVTILDDHLERKGPAWIAERTLSQEVAAVGISVNLATVEAAGDIVAAIRRRTRLPVIIGGPEVTANLDYALNKTGAQYAIVGEGERTLVELLNQVFSEGDLGDVSGLAYWSEEEQSYRVNRTRPWIDMDEIPLLPYDLLNLERYDRSYAEFSSEHVEVLNTSRGCPFQCTVCSNKHVWSTTYRTMSPARMLLHVRHALEQTGAKGIYFREDHFTLDSGRVLEFCDRVIQDGLVFEWGCESRVNNISLELVQKMYQAGLRSIWFGVESGSDRVLRQLKKGITVEQVKKAVKICRQVGVKVGFSVMLGMPEETREELKQTIDFVFGMRPDWVYWAAFLGLPGSPLYAYLEDHPELVFRRWHNLILPHGGGISYPEKLRLKQNLELRFNLQPRILVGHLKRMGWRRFCGKSYSNLKRILLTRRNSLNLRMK